MTKEELRQEIESLNELLDKVQSKSLELGNEAYYIWLEEPVAERECSTLSSKLWDASERIGDVIDTLNNNNE